MENNKELELLREFFNNVSKDGGEDEYLRLFDEILEIQKKNKLKRRINYFATLITPHQQGELYEILKELGYEH